MTIGIRRHALAVCLAGALLVPATATADPILIRWGYLDITDVSFGSGLGGELNIRGTDLQLERQFALRAFTGFGVFMPGLQCFTGCPPGTSTDLLAHWVGRDLRGTATLDGRTFHLNDLANAGVTFSGEAVLPPLDSLTATVMAPFRFEGSFFYRDLTEIIQTREGLRGGGVATLWLNRVAPQIVEQGFPDGWVVERGRYDFVDPIPEPATLLLLGVGLGGLAGRAYRRRRIA